MSRFRPTGFKRMSGPKRKYRKRESKYRIAPLGRRFGLWTVLGISRERTYSNGKIRWSWLCRCECGTEKEVSVETLRIGNSKSCGCRRSECTSQMLTRHGQAGTNEYEIWGAMKQRCLNPNNKRWASYGGRGITVCERWLVFENFYADMGAQPQGLTLDRVNNDGPYSPENCRWTTQEEQRANTRRTVRVVYNNKSMNLAGLARLAGLDRRTLRWRLRAGWTVADAVRVSPRGKRG